MKPGEILYEGKAKQLFITEDPYVLRVQYKDSATAFNGEKKAILQGKGEMNNRISTLFFQYLTAQGIPNHWLESISPLEQLVRKAKMIPLEVVVRNIAAGTLCKRIGQAEGTPLHHPIVEFYYKNDALGDPLVNSDHIAVLALATEAQQTAMRTYALQVNSLLQSWMAQQQITLVDFKLEFGIDHQGQLLLADEISPDTCRFWDAQTGKKLDKDRFRRDLGQVVEAYEEILMRLGGKKSV
jgi:phosphoribosylaminoimidazole-succinocarboxamide synthase